MSNKWKNNGYTATEVQSEGVILQVAEEKALPVFAEMTGLKESVSAISNKMDSVHEKINDVSTAAEKARVAMAELKTMGDTPTGKLLLALAGDKIQNLDAQLTDSAKKAVEVEVLSMRQLSRSMNERIDAIEAKYGIPVKQSVPATKSRTGLGNITADTQKDLEDVLNSRGYEGIFFELQSDGIHYRVYATKPGFKQRDTLFSSNVNRDWL